MIQFTINEPPMPDAKGLINQDRMVRWYRDSARTVADDDAISDFVRGRYRIHVVCSNLSKQKRNLIAELVSAWLDSLGLKERSYFSDGVKDHIKNTATNGRVIVRIVDESGDGVHLPFVDFKSACERACAQVAA